MSNYCKRIGTILIFTRGYCGDWDLLDVFPYYFYPFLIVFPFKVGFTYPYLIIPKLSRISLAAKTDVFHVSLNVIYVCASHFGKSPFYPCAVSP